MFDNAKELFSEKNYIPSYMSMLLSIFTSHADGLGSAGSERA